MKLNQRAKAILVAASITLLLLEGLANAKDGAYRVIHTFTGTPDACDAVGLLAAAGNGDLYGVAQHCGAHDAGAVFKLTAPRAAGGAWRETVIYNFLNDDLGYPTTLVMGNDGTLYGAGYSQNSSGFIFQLTPPVGGGVWQYDVLYIFNNDNHADGVFVEGITLDAEGNIYGTTGLGGNPSCSWGGGLGCGVVFELKRPTKNGGNWAFSVLYAFTGNPDAALPVTGVTLDQKGNIYGTTNNGGTYGYGTVYRVSPPTQKGGPWTETVLYSLDSGTNMGSNAEGPVTFDESGNMYGTTAFGGDLNCSGGFGCGVVFELSPQTGGTWTYTNLYSFQDGSDGAEPTGTIVIDRKGSLYSTTTLGGGGTNAGTAFKLSPPQQEGDPWTETVLHTFKATDDEGDTGGLIWGKWHSLYGVTYSGGKYNGGVVFELQP